MSLVEAGNPIHGGVVIEGGQQLIWRRRSIITSAQLLALFATPISIVPTPGTDKALIFEGMMIQKPSGVAYAGIAAGEDLSVKYTDASGLELGGCETTGFLDQTTDQIRFIRPYNATSGLSQIILVANAILVLHLLVAEIITGDSDLNCEVYYRVVDTTP